MYRAHCLHYCIGYNPIEGIWQRDFQKLWQRDFKKSSLFNPFTVPGKFDAFEI
jgi:hypothetical protein